MKRWDVAGMMAIGRKLFAKIHKQKHHANPNHDVHLMARELDDWLTNCIYPTELSKIFYFNNSSQHLST